MNCFFMGCAQTGSKNCWFFVYYPAFEKVIKVVFYFEKNQSASTANSTQQYGRS